MNRRHLLFTTLFLAMLNFGHAAALEVGADAPAVAGISDEGEAVNLADVYAGHDYTLVYFYPKADTPGCTAQGCSLRDSYEELTAKGVAVVGVSTDDVAAQAAFKAKHMLPFTLIADTDHTIMNAFGVPSLRNVMASRQAYLVHNGKIVYADHKGSTTQQAADILGFLK